MAQPKRRWSKARTGLRKQGGNRDGTTKKKMV